MSGSCFQNQHHRFENPNLCVFVSGITNPNNVYKICTYIIRKEGKKCRLCFSESRGHGTAETFSAVYQFYDRRTIEEIISKYNNKFLFGDRLTVGLLTEHARTVLRAQQNNRAYNTPLFRPVMDVPFFSNVSTQSSNIPSTKEHFSNGYKKSGKKAPTSRSQNWRKRKADRLDDRKLNEELKKVKERIEKAIFLPQKKALESPENSGSKVSKHGTNNAQPKTEQNLKVNKANIKIHESIPSVNKDSAKGGKSPLSKEKDAEVNVSFSKEVNRSLDSHLVIKQRKLDQFDKVKNLKEHVNASKREIVNQLANGYQSQFNAVNGRVSKSHEMSKEMKEESKKQTNGHLEIVVEKHNSRRNSSSSSSSSSSGGSGSSDGSSVASSSSDVSTTSSSCNDGADSNEENVGCVSNNSGSNDSERNDSGRSDSGRSDSGRNDSLRNKSGRNDSLHDSSGKNDSSHDSSVSSSNANSRCLSIEKDPGVVEDAITSSNIKLQALSTTEKVNQGKGKEIENIVHSPVKKQRKMHRQMLGLNASGIDQMSAVSGQFHNFRGKWKRCVARNKSNNTSVDNFEEVNRGRKWTGNMNEANKIVSQSDCRAKKVKLFNDRRKRLKKKRIAKAKVKAQKIILERKLKKIEKNYLDGSETIAMVVKLIARKLPEHEKLLGDALTQVLTEFKDECLIHSKVVLDKATTLPDVAADR
eukprot:gene6063-6765_t